MDTAVQKESISSPSEKEILKRLAVLIETTCGLDKKDKYGRPFKIAWAEVLGALIQEIQQPLLIFDALDNFVEFLWLKAYTGHARCFHTTVAQYYKCPSTNTTEFLDLLRRYYN